MSGMGRREAIKAAFLSIASTKIAPVVSLSPEPIQQVSNSVNRELDDLRQTFTDASRFLQPGPDRLDEDATLRGERPVPTIITFAEWKQIAAAWRKLANLDVRDPDHPAAANSAIPVIRIEKDVRSRIQIKSADLQEVYRYWHVEDLLDQAADLLDRATRTRTEWNELAVRAANITFDLEEFFLSDEVARGEVEAGLYTIEVKENTADAGAEYARRRARRISGAVLTKLRQQRYEDPDEIKAQTQLSALAAFVAAVPSFVTEFSNASGRGWQQYNEPTLGPFGNHSKKEHLATVNLNEVLLRQVTAFASLSSQNIIDEAEERASAQRERAAFERRSLALKMIDFRRRRLMIQRQMAELKTNACTQAGGVLNYVERMGALRPKFDQDLKEAVSRILVAADGLSQIYGYSIKTPEVTQSLKDGFVGNPDSTLILDESVIWVRNSINWLVRFGQLEQRYTLALSVRQLAGEDVWRRALDNWRKGTASAVEIKFKVSDGEFPNQCHVRLGAISAFMVGGGDAPWSLKARIPVDGKSWHLGQNTNDTPITLDQRALPLLRMGRVTSRSATQAADLYGAGILRNLSPIGDWVLTGTPISARGKNADPEDIHLDLAIAVRESTDVPHSTL